MPRSAHDVIDAETYIFLGGYRRPSPLQQNVWSLVPDDPNIEKAPDHSSSDRNYNNYAVYWPARTANGGLRQPQRDSCGPILRSSRANGSASSTGSNSPLTIAVAFPARSRRIARGFKLRHARPLPKCCSLAGGATLNR